MVNHLSYKISGDYVKLNKRQQLGVLDIIRPEMENISVKIVIHSRGKTDRKMLWVEYEKNGEEYRSIIPAYGLGSKKLSRSDSCNLSTR